MGKFLRRHESEYDVFGAGHAGTSISAATGIAEAIRRRGGREKVVAVIGDGAMTAGMAYEGLNNAGYLRPLEPGRGAERQRDVDLEERRRAHRASSRGAGRRRRRAG